ncbi:MAG: hypothetical protein RRC07_05765 [Anaerolineae bacterium]|nr:hypothetical protein [Anaerolineae bacterium]
MRTFEGSNTLLAKASLPGYGEFQGQLARLELTSLPESPGDRENCEDPADYFGTTLWEGSIQSHE